MSTTSEELKKLYKKLGGDEENIRKASTPAEILNGINELDLTIPGGIEDLNDVDISDPETGDVIRYNGEAWVNDQDSVTKTASGNPIEVSDSTSAPLVKCVTEIQGSQDLHGYDKPWVGGAGVNKANPSVTTETTESAVRCTPIKDSGGNITHYVLNGTTSGIGGFIPFEFPVSNAEKQYYVQFYDFATLSGASKFGFDRTSSTNINVSQNVVTIPANHVCVCGVYFNSSGIVFDNFVLKCSISETNMTAFAPYSNICPITAYTEGEIEVRGHNVSDEVYESGYIDLDTGANAVSTTTKRTTNYIKIQPNTQYCYVSSSANSVRMAFYGEDKSYVGKFGNNNANPQIFTTPNNAYYLRYYIGNDGHAGVNYPKTVNTYEPYVGTTHTTTYPSAIFRGSEDVVKSTETHDMVVVDLGDYDWTIQVIDGNNCFRTTLDNKTFTTNAICSQYSFSNRCEEDGTFSTVIGSANHLFVRDSRYSTTAEFKTGVTGVKLAYQLATPTTSSVTPTNVPVKSLNGYSHIESSTGDLEVEYITGKYQPIVDLISESSGGDSQHHYSTNEQVVGTWIDGKTLYEKTLTYNQSYTYSNSGWDEIPFTGVPTDIETAISLDIIGGDDDGMQFHDGRVRYMVDLSGSTPKIMAYTTQAQQSVTWIIITMRYTKTASTRSLSKGATEKTSLEPISEPLETKTDNLSEDEIELKEEDEVKELEEEPGEQRRYLME